MVTVIFFSADMGHATYYVKLVSTESKAAELYAQICSAKIIQGKHVIIYNVCVSG